MIRFCNTTSVPVIRSHWLRGVYQPKRRSSRWRLARRVSNRLESDIQLLPAHFSQPISSNPFITQFASPFHELRFQARSPTPCHDFRQMPRTPAVGHREAALCAQWRLSTYFGLVLREARRKLTGSGGSPTCSNKPLWGSRNTNGVLEPIMTNVGSKVHHQISMCLSLMSNHCWAVGSRAG